MVVWFLSSCAYAYYFTVGIGQSNQPKLGLGECVEYFTKHVVLLRIYMHMPTHVHVYCMHVHTHCTLDDWMMYYIHYNFIWRRSWWGLWYWNWLRGRTRK